MTVHSFTTQKRHGDARAAGILASTLRFKKLPDTFASTEQIHGSEVRIVPKLGSAKKYPKADGLLTEVSHQPLAIFTADCVPLFISADRGRVVGLLHAGWRGTRAGILKKAVRLLRQRWAIPARRVNVWTGPSIGACCFEVQWDVARYFPRTRRKTKDRWRVHLVDELRAQARQIGVSFMKTKGGALCTMHNSSFHSYRRDQTSQRMASVIMKKS